jgi:penicillin-binding protein 1C
VRAVDLKSLPRWTRLLGAAGSIVLLARLAPPVEFRQLYADRAFRVLDRNGEVLRTVSRERGFYVPLTDISPHLITATLFSEDRHFYWHCGIDPLSLARAASQNIRAGRTVSGGSTITMQLARILLGPRPRGIGTKVDEMLLALYLESRLSKDRILEYYLNNAPYGNTGRGCEAASRACFGMGAASLDPAQASLLAVIPRNPRLYDPARHPERLEQARRRLAGSMARERMIPDSLSAAMARPPQVLPEVPWTFAAPHFCDWVLAGARPGGGDIRTTVDARLNADLEKHVRAYVRKLRIYGITNAAVVVIDNRSMSVAAMVGSADYFNPLISGQCNGAAAPRQPGSALKPFTYGIALERGFPASYLLPDLDIAEGTAAEKYLPRNYDERYHGPVRMRTALGCSYNVAAVRVLERIGTGTLLDRLHAAGFASLKQNAEHYGPGLTLGNGEVTLLELTRAYAALAHGGMFRNERAFAAQPPADSSRVFSPQVAYILTQIMSDRSARAPAFGECSPVDLPFPCAAKTGTTKDYRDNWTAGFTADYTVGVWVGNFDGTPMHGVSGISGAGPLFRDIMLTLHRDKRPEAFPRPEGVIAARVCPLSGDPVSRYCRDGMTEYFLAGQEPHEACRFHGPGAAIRVPALYGGWAGKKDAAAYRVADGGELRVAFPVQDDVFRIDPGMAGEFQAIRFQAVVPAGFGGLRWILDGRPIGGSRSPSWRLAPGEHTVSVTATRNGIPVRSRPVRFLVLS